VDAAATQVGLLQTGDERGSFAPSRIKFFQKNVEALYAVSPHSGDFVLIVDSQSRFVVLDDESDALHKVALILLNEMPNNLFHTPASGT